MLHSRDPWEVWTGDRPDGSNLSSLGSVGTGLGVIGIIDLF